MAPPIVDTDEGHNRNSEHGQTDIRQRCRSTAIVEPEIFAVDPAAIVSPSDVAPRLVVEAAADVHRISFRNDTDAGKLGIRPASDIDIGRRETGRGLRRGCRGNSDQRQPGKRPNQGMLFHDLTI